MGGCLNSIVYGDTADELMIEAAEAEGLFYQLYESKTGKLVGGGVVSIDMLAKVVQKKGEADDLPPLFSELNYIKK